MDICFENFKKCFLSLYKAQELTIKDFGDIILTSSSSRIADLNLIFYNTSKPLEFEEKSMDLTNKFVSEQNNPFVFVDSNRQKTFKKNILKKNGFKYRRSDIGMMKKSSSNMLLTDSSLYNVREANCEKVLLDACSIMSEAFETPLQDIKNVFFSDYVINSLNPHTFYVLYDIENTPISSSMIYYDNTNKTSGHYCWATVKCGRKSGCMTYLISKVLKITQERGYKISCGTYNLNSKNIARKLGFNNYSKLNFYSK